MVSQTLVFLQYLAKSKYFTIIDGDDDVLYLFNHLKRSECDCLARNKYPNPCQAVSESDCVTRNQFDLLIRNMSMIEREYFLCVEVISMFP